MKRRRWLFALAMVGAMLSGCWDRVQLEDQMYVIKLGLDRHPSGKLMVSAQVAMTQYLTAGIFRGPSQATHTSAACETMAVAADSISQALRMMNGSLTRSLTLDHLRAVLFGEALGREGLEPHVMELFREPIGRGTVLAAQVKEFTAYEVLKECSPLGEINVAKVPEGFIQQHKRYHLAPPMRMHQFLIRLGAPGVGAYLPVVSLNRGIDRQPEELDVNQKSATAGDMERAGGRPIEFLGTAVYKDDKLRGYLNVDETQMLLLLRGEMGKTYVTFTDPTEPNYQVTMRFQQENMPQYRAAFVNGKPFVAVRLLLEGEVLAVPGGTDYVPPEARTRLEAAAVREAERTLGELLTKLKQWEVDPVGFGLLFRGRFANWQEWTAYDWGKHVGDLQVEPKVAMRIRRYGLYTGPDRTRGGGR